MAISVFSANNNSLFVTNENAARNSQKTKNTEGNIFAGNFNMQENTIEIKRKLAQKRAMKILTDTFASDQKIDSSVDGLRAQQEQLKKEALEDKKVVKEVQEQRTQLMEDYNITENSKEHKDLELLRKERDASNPLSGIELTDSEKEKLAALHENGLTDYQKDMLELDGREDIYRQRAAQKETASKAISGAIADIGIERLKHHEMVDSSKQADEIMEQANKELIGSLYDEARDHIDEKMEEVQEKAEEKAEKQKEEDEKKAERKKEQLELEKQIEEAKKNSEQTASASQQDEPVTSPVVTRDTADVQNIVSGNPDSTPSEEKIDRELAKILEELKLLEEDIKGSKVDVNI
ncbi:MAG TPA: hypothetical protein DCZ23_03575 [Lachnospiraceae bacterium]|nr:hypothetical protein [Lachnospiraceae bacterium]